MCSQYVTTSVVHLQVKKLKIFLSGDAPHPIGRPTECGVGDFEVEEAMIAESCPCDGLELYAHETC